MSYILQMNLKCEVTISNVEHFTYFNSEGV